MLFHKLFRKVVIVLTFISFSLEGAIQLAYARPHAEDRYTEGQWGFTSDHLPVVGKVKLPEHQFLAMSFNVLNEKFSKYLTGNQKLSGSTLHQFFSGDQTPRVEKNVDIVVQALTDFRRPVALVAIQEASPLFIDLLESKLGDKRERGEINWIIQSNRSEDHQSDDFGILIFDSKQLALNGIHGAGSYKGTWTVQDTGEVKHYVTKYIQHVTFRHIQSGIILEGINTHMDMNGFGSFVGFLNDRLGETISHRNLLVLGDLNLAHTELLEQIEKFPTLKLSALPPHTYSHVATTEKKDRGDKLATFDHVLVSGPQLAIEQALEVEEATRSTFSITNWPQ